MATSPTLGLSHAELLGRVALFAGLSNVALARLAAHVEPESVRDGATVCVQGETGDSLYIVVRGTFGVFIAAAGDAGETRVGTLEPADYFGEMALLTDEPRSATVRAEGDGEVLRLERARFCALFEQEPSAALTIAATLCSRLRVADDAIAQSTRAIGATVEQLLSGLPPDRRTRLLQASVLDDVWTRALGALFGPDADRVAEDLTALGVGIDRPPGPVLGVLRDRWEQTSGREAAAAFAAQAAGQLAAVGCWHEALAVRARYGTRPVWLATLGQALRADPALSAERARRSLEHLTDEEAQQDTELALARAEVLVERDKPAGALAVLRQALEAAIVRGDADGGRRISVELARLAGADEAPPPDTRGHRLAVALAPVAAVRPRQFGRQELFGLLGAAAFLGGAAIMRSNAQWVFVLLLAAALVLWLTEVFPDFAVSLGLVAAWIIWGIATPAEALGGFASMNWIFVVSVLAIATAIARSGLLFRAGLLLVRRMPPGLFWQAGTLMLTGVLLAPLLPQNQGRAALTSPIALAVAEAARLKDREPAAALLGLAAWFGAGPLMFVFLNGSPL